MSQKYETISLVTSFGETAVLRRSSSGNVICPVCGYEEQESEGWSLDGYLLSQEECPGCDMEHGVDDIDLVPPEPHNPLMLRWRKLRIQWLDRIGWPEWATRQLHERLGVDEQQLLADKAAFL